MKDKLRELAAEWLRKGEFSKNSGAPRCGGQMIEDATELLAILDAEGDAWKSFHQHEREQFRKEMRAALEHFAKGERHER